MYETIFKIFQICFDIFVIGFIIKNWKKTRND